MQVLLKATPEHMQSGVYLGLNKSVVPLWEDGVNIAFREVGVKKIGGGQEVSSLPPAQGKPWDMEQANVAGKSRVFVGTVQGIQLVELVGSSWGSATVYTWPSPSQYADLETWGAWIVGTNGVNKLAVWKNAGAGEVLVGTTFDWAKVIKRKSPFLLAMNTSVGEDSIHWCADSNIELWTPAADNTAGQMSLRDIDSGIVACEDIQDYLAVYSRHTMHVGKYAGGGVWSWKRALSGIGAVSRRSVVTVDPYNYGLNENGIWKTDANTFVYLDDPAVSRWLLDRIDWQRRAEVWGFHDSRLKQIRWQYPTKATLGGHSEIICFGYEGSVFTRSSLLLAAADKQEVFPYPIVVNDTGHVAYWQGEEEHYGADVQWMFRSKPLDFGANQSFKTVELVLVDGAWSMQDDAQLRITALQYPEDKNEVLVHHEQLRRRNYLKNGGFEAPFFKIEIYGTRPATINLIEVWGNPAGLAF